MDIYEAALARHSVRSYTDEKIDEKAAAKLREAIEAVNLESGMNFQLNLDEPEGFSEAFAMYGRFDGVTDYIAVVGPEGMDVEAGYYGEKLVLEAQMLGICSCWVARTFNEKKAKYTLRPGDKLYVVISLGYGVDAGKPHISKKAEEVSNADENSPQWFRDGVAASLLAPTAMNRQDFGFELAPDGETVVPKIADGAYGGIDMGIAQFHFDLGSGRRNFNK